MDAIMRSHRVGRFLSDRHYYRSSVAYCGLIMLAVAIAESRR